MFRALFKMMVNKDWQAIIEERLANFVDEKIGEVGGLSLHVSSFQMDDFMTLDFTILGDVNLKTLRGAIIQFELDNSRIESYNSNNLEIDSDYVSGANFGFTKIDLEVDNEMKKMILSKRVHFIKFIIGKTEIKIKLLDPFALKKVIDSDILT